MVGMIVGILDVWTKPKLQQTPLDEAFMAVQVIVALALCVGLLACYSTVREWLRR